MRSLLGYGDRLSVCAGERIGFHVSTRAGELAYQADVVRLGSAVDRPLGPGIEETPVPGAPVFRGLARYERIDRGARAIVPTSPALAGLASFSAQIEIWPTKPGSREQALFGTWDAAARAGFALFLAADGSASVRLGDGRGAFAEHATGVPLRALEWARISVVFDARAGTLRLVQAPFADGAGARASTRRVEVRTALRTIEHGSAARPLVFAAWRAGHDARGPLFAAHFDGKLEAPRLAGDALEDADLEAIATPTPPASLLARLVGAWDLGRAPEGRRIFDLSPNALHGTLENLPLRGVTGRRWDASRHDPRLGAEHHAAIHFHADDVYDAGWPRAFELAVPREWRSGLYAVRLQLDGRTVDHLPFFVTPPRGEARAKLAFLAPTATYLAYANLLPPHTYAAVLAGRGGELDAELLAAEQEFGGGCYHTHDDGSGIHHSSWLRPLLSLRPQRDPWGLNADSLLLRFLDAIGLDYDVITDHQLHEEGTALLSRYRAVLTGTHPEYDTTRMLDALEAWLAAGGRLFYAGANGFYWRIALSHQWPAALELRRAEDGTRTWEARPGEYHHAWTGELGGLWRRIGRPPNRLVGTGFCAQGFLDGRPYRLLPAARDPRAAWIFDGVAGDEIGAFGPLGGAACEEIDRTDDVLGTPPHALRLASASGFGPDMLKTKEEFLYMAPLDPQDPHVRADLVFFETPKGGAVFSTGSIAWAGSLPYANHRNEIARISENVLRRFLDPTPFPAPDPATGPPQTSGCD